MKSFGFKSNSDSGVFWLLDTDESEKALLDLIGIVARISFGSCVMKEL